VAAPRSKTVSAQPRKPAAVPAEALADEAPAPAPAATRAPTPIAAASLNDDDWQTF
jgi:hypothetical protein